MSKHFRERLAAIRQQLLAAYSGSVVLSSATKGRERELFVNLFLKSAFPPQYRFGSGEIADSIGNKTGQLDIVVELPFFPSLPLVGLPDHRLYFVEGVCAVIEVKSDLKAGWEAVERTAKAFDPLLHCSFSGQARDTRFGVECIAFIAVGFRGWQNSDALLERRRNPVGAILQLDPPFFVCPGRHASDPNVVIEGDDALGAMVVVLNEHLVGWESKRSPIHQYFEGEASGPSK